MSKIKVNRLENTATAAGGLDIDSSGNVGIGTSSFDSTSSGRQILEINGTSSTLINLDVGGTRKAYHFTDGTSVYSYNTANGNYIFGTNNTERMRITNAGAVAVNNTTGVYSDLSLGKLHVINDEADKYAAAFYHGGNNANRKGILIGAGQNSGSGTLIAFFDGDGNGMGTVTFSGSTTAYNTSSDYRLKENVVDIDGAISRIKQLAPKRFNFIGVERTVDGFLAHEAQTVVPEAVTGQKDATKEEEYVVTPAVEEVIDEDGNVTTAAVDAVMGTRTVPDHQGIDQSKLVPLLTAALQEAIAKIETLETKVAALEAG